MTTMHGGGFTKASYTPREVLKDLTGYTAYDGTLEANARDVRTGDLLAKNSSTNRWAVRRSTVLAVQGENMDDTIEVADAHPFKVGEAITVTGESATTITAINYTTNVITLAAALTGTRAIGVRVYNASNAMGTAHGLYALGERMPSRAEEAYVPVCVAGHFSYSKILNFDSQARTDLGGRSNTQTDSYLL